MGRLLAAAHTWSALYEFAEFDELLDVFAAVDSLKCVLAANVRRLNAGIVAARAHALNKPRPLDALAETADQIDRCLSVVFLYLCVYCHYRANNSIRSLHPQGFEETGHFGHWEGNLGAILHGAHDNRAVESLPLAHNNEVRHALGLGGGKLHAEAA